MKYTIPEILVDQIKLIEIPEFSKKKISRVFLNMILSITPTEELPSEDEWNSDVTQAHDSEAQAPIALPSDVDIGLEEINLWKEIYIALNKDGAVIGYVVKENADDLKYSREKECVGFTFHDHLVEALNQFKSDAYFSVINTLREYYDKHK
jgi:hypothetical protein